MALVKSDTPLKPAGPPAIWTAFARQGRWKNWVLGSQFLVIGLLLATNLALANRPPDVVLVTEEGKSTYVPSNLAGEALTRWVNEQKQAPSDLTLLHFARTFLGLAVGVNSTTIESAWPEALSLMAPGLRDRMAKQSAADKLVESTKVARVQTQIVVEDLVAVERTRDLVHLRAKVNRFKSSLLASTKTFDALSVDLVVRVVPRSLRHPDGLQVAEWTLRNETAPAANANQEPSPNGN